MKQKLEKEREKLRSIGTLITREESMATKKESEGGLKEKA